MKKLVSIIVKVLCATIFGVYCSLLYLERNQKFHAYIDQAIVHFYIRDLKAHFDGRVAKINFMQSKVVFEDVFVRPVKESKEWYWSSKRMTFNVSWWYWFFYGSLGLHVDVQDLKAHSKVENGQPTILEHGMFFLQGASLALPISLRTVTVHNGQLVVSDDAREYAIFWNGISGRGSKAFKSQLFVTDGYLSYNGQEILKNIEGTTHFDVQYAAEEGTVCTFSTDSFVAISQLPELSQKCYVRGFWNGDNGKLTLYNDDLSFTCDPATFTRVGKDIFVEACLECPFSLCGAFFKQTYNSILSGKCRVDIMGDIAKKIRVKCLIKEPSYGSYSLQDITSGMSIDKDGVWGTFSCAQEDERLRGVYTYNLKTKKIETLVHVSHQWSLSPGSHWKFMSEDTQLLTVLDGSKVSAKSTGTLWHAKTGERVPFDAGLKLTEHFFTGNVQALGLKFDTLVYLYPYLKLAHVSCTDEVGAELLGFHTDRHTHSKWYAHCTFPGLKKLVQAFTDQIITGQGTLKASGLYKKSKITGSVELQGAAIRIPSVYNVVTDLQGDFKYDAYQGFLSGNNWMVTLHKGSIGCPSWNVYVESGVGCSFVYIPWVMNRCFVNWRKDLFALVSGAGVFSKNGNEKNIQADLVVEQAQLKQNIFELLNHSHSPKKSSESSPIGLAVSLETKDPVLVKTDSLETAARIAVEVVGTDVTPKIGGKINLQGGTIQFPFTKLPIIKGDIYIQGSEQDDPLVNLLVQGNIKKHIITLHVTGSAHNPNIHFSSLPYLTDEQIISLLFTGNYDDSLNVLVPAFLMKNVEGILFGTAHAYAGKNSLMSKFLKPLSRIKVVPRFADQTGRGGIRAALEVEVSDRLHATLQKNFSLSEDTRFEVEYLVSDDMSIKGVKDERSDLGAELEMRFKF